MNQSATIESLWSSYIADWASSGAFDQAAAAAFADSYSLSQANRLIHIILSSDSTLLPRVFELSPEYLNNHFAAFSAQANAIYVDSDLRSFPGLAESVFAHELGHWVDYQLNGESTDHVSVRLFANLLTGRSVDSGSDHEHSHDSSGASGRLTLPGGEEVDVQFFDTPTHVNWIKEQLPFLSANATQVITNAQNDTDYFNASSYSTVGPLKYSPYGLQTHSPSHFDNNNISGGLSAIRSRWNSGIQKFNSSSIAAVTSEQFLGKNNIDALANPSFTGPDAGIQHLLYRFGQINHAFEDFYSHSNWVETSKKGLIPSSRLLEGSLELPVVLQPGNKIPGTNVVVAQSGPNWAASLKKSGTGSYSGSKYDVYWNVNSAAPSAGGGVVSATTLDGKTIYGLATGATNGAIYKDADRSVFLRDPSKTAFYQKEYFRGFDHGGVAGTVYGQWVGPLNKDKEDNPNFLAAKKLANLQLQNEWDRMGNLIFKSYGVDGLRRFANYALASQESRDAYVSTYSVPGARYFQSPSSLNLASPLSLSVASSQPGVSLNASSDSDGAALSAELPEIRLVQLFSTAFFDILNPFGSYRYRYQFKDPSTGAWLDTDFNDISIHHELEPDEIEQLTTPSSIQHAERGERAVWAMSREDSLSQSATNYYVEFFNKPSFPVYIEDFDIAHDRIILVDEVGNEAELSEELYDSSKFNDLTVELLKSGILVNFRPKLQLDPGAVLISEAQLSQPLVIGADSVAGDLQGESLFFTGFDGSIPFLELVDGSLQAATVDPSYAGKTYTAYVDVSDGTSVVRSVPVTVAVAPKLLIDGVSFASDSSFRLDYETLAQDGFEIIAQVSDHLDGTLDSFRSVATSIGRASGTPIGYNPSGVTVNLTDELDSGNVSFWLSSASGEAQALNVFSLEDKTFGLFLGDRRIATLTPLVAGSDSPEISTLSSLNLLDDGLGIGLNQSFTDRPLNADNTPWTVTLSLDLFREAAYSSQVGLYLYDKVSGDIVDPVTGVSYNEDTDAWYEDAERFAVWTGTTNNLSASSFATSFSVDGRLDLDSLALMPFMKTQIDDRVYHYSSFDSLNADGFRHIAELSRNVFGFEDMLGLGDSDLDDMILRVNSLAVV